jgi:signal transduction histidine kinase
MTERTSWRAGFGWLTALAVAAVLAVNVAGVIEIAAARREALDEATQLLQLGTAGRAREIESILAGTRADLAFLTASSIFFDLESALASDDPTEARWRRLEAEGTLLLFLRGHPEVSHLVTHATDGKPLLEVARRGGIPVLWTSTDAEMPDAVPGEAVDATPRAITASFSFSTGSRTVSGAVGLQATLDAAALLTETGSGEVAPPFCRLADAAGIPLALEPAPSVDGSPSAQEGLVAEAEIVAEGWSVASPWRLRCTRSGEGVLAVVDPVVAGYRTALLLNLAAMVSAIVLGSLVFQQARRRQRLEAEAREEARIRELERQLFHAERLSTVGRLAAGIAHEVNNPLEGMVNYLGLARGDLERGDVDSARRRLEQAREGLQQAVDIIQQVRAHSEPANAPQRTLDLAPVLQQSVDFVSSRPEFESIRFTLESDGKPPPIRGNATMLGQVFLNLLVNACEAQPRGGEVVVRTHHDSGRVTVEIADRGPGVPPDEAVKIFEPFHSTKESTGLGLSICYAIADQHGAELGVTDRPGGGAVFTMVFPPLKEADG